MNLANPARARDVVVGFALGVLYVGSLAPLLARVAHLRPTATHAAIYRATHSLPDTLKVLWKCLLYILTGRPSDRLELGLLIVARVLLFVDLAWQVVIGVRWP